MNRVPRAAASTIIALATATVVVALGMLLFLNPVWVAFEQDRAQAHEWTGLSEAQLRPVTNAILEDLVLGPPDFDAVVDGTPVLNDRERGHMRDVRSVFAGFYAVAAVAAVVLLLAWLRRGDGMVFWRRIARSGRALAIGTVVVGGLGVLFFDAAFALFHQLFFPAGSYNFDPATERLVQLFPYQFWIETTAVLGGVLVVAGIVLSWAGGRRAARPAGTPR